MLHVAWAQLNRNIYSLFIKRNKLIHSTEKKLVSKGKRGNGHGARHFCLSFFWHSGQIQWHQGTTYCSRWNLDMLAFRCRSDSFVYNENHADNHEISVPWEWDQCVAVDSHLSVSDWGHPPVGGSSNNTYFSGVFSTAARGSSSMDQGAKKNVFFSWTWGRNFREKLC